MGAVFEWKMAPIESYMHIDEQKPKQWFSLRPGEEKIDTERFSLDGVTTEIIAECDKGDIDGTVLVNTSSPGDMGILLYENDQDFDPKPLETGEKYHFSGTQRIEVHSAHHEEFVSFRHNVATGVIVNRKDAFAAKTALFRTKPVVEPKPILVGASAR